jgi:hypothetical protein
MPDEPTPACASERCGSAAPGLRGRQRKSLHGSLRHKKGWYLATGRLRLDDGTRLSQRRTMPGEGALEQDPAVALAQRIRAIRDEVAARAAVGEE